MPTDLLRQVRLLDPVRHGDRVTDVLIVDGWIRAIAPQISAPAEAVVQDCTGLVLGPGLVDLYSHSGEPGFESRETLDALMAAAAAGGFTRLTLLPTTSPTVDNAAMVQWLRSHVQLPSPQIRCWGALTVGAAGQQMAELAELAESGIVGFADGMPIQNWGLLRRSLEYAQALGKPIALACCDLQLRGNGVMREGSDSIRMGLPGAPAIAETAALAALLECVEQIGTPVHLMRVSTARSVELIAQAKARHLPITASTTWMHLLLNTQALQRYDPNLRLEPPLGTPADQAALIQAVNDGVIEAIAIDHCPYTYEEKTVPFAEAPAGAIGLELALPLLWQHLVTSGKLSALTLWRTLSSDPSRCLHQPPAAVEVDAIAELTLFDPHHPWLVSGKTLKSLARNTPWLGQEIVGRVIQTWG